LDKKIAIVFSIILISGTTPAFGGVGPGIGEGPFPGLVGGFENNYVHACWTWETQPDQSALPNCGGLAASDPKLQLSFSNVMPLGTCFNGACNFVLPNWIDELRFKDIKITVSYENTPGVSNTPPNMPGVTCYDPTLPGGMTSGTYQATVPSTNTVMWFFECEPNPDWEEIVFTYDPTLTSILQVDIWTTSFEKSSPVGGDMIQMETTSILAAGAQYTAAWMIPVIVSAIGIGIVLARRF
jgi:hypothetical protein